jgi:hypothetical protein
MSQYHLATDKDFDDFRTKCEEEEGWELAFEDATSKVHRKRNTGAAIDPVRVKAHFANMNPETLYDILHDHEYRAVWDENMISGVVIQQLDDRNEIGYYSAKAPSPISNRDFLNQRMWRRKSDEWIIMNHAVEHADWPEKKRLRSSYLYLYWLLHSKKGPRLHLHLLHSIQSKRLDSWVGDQQHHVNVRT